MAKKKRIKIGAMYREYGEMEGQLTENVIANAGHMV